MKRVFLVFNLFMVSVAEAQVAQQTITKIFIHHCVPSIKHPQAPDQKAPLKNATWDPDTMIFQCYYALGDEQVYEDPAARIVFTDPEKAKYCSLNEQELSLHCDEK